MRFARPRPPFAIGPVLQHRPFAGVAGADVEVGADEGEAGGTGVDELGRDLAEEGAFGVELVDRRLGVFEAGLQVVDDEDVFVYGVDRHRGVYQ